MWYLLGFAVFFAIIVIIGVLAALNSSIELKTVLIKIDRSKSVEENFNAMYDKMNTIGHEKIDGISFISLEKNIDVEINDIDEIINSDYIKIEYFEDKEL